MQQYVCDRCAKKVNTHGDMVMLLSPDYGKGVRLEREFCSYTCAREDLIDFVAKVDQAIQEKATINLYEQEFAALGGDDLDERGRNT